MGRLVDHLKASGDLDNTLILILSDNGGNGEGVPGGRTGTRPWGGPHSGVFSGMNWASLQNTPFRSFKHFTHEGGIATPLIAHRPVAMAAHRRGGFEHAPGHLIDVVPTVLGLASVRYPKTYGGKPVLPLSGVSMLPAFKGQPVTRSQALFWEHEGNRAARDGPWKAVRRLGHPWELYDMSRHRTQTDNVASSHPQVLRRLTEAWDVWAQAGFVDEWPEKTAREDWGRWREARRAATEPAGRLGLWRPEGWQEPSAAPEQDPAHKTLRGGTACGDSRHGSRVLLALKRFTAHGARGAPGPVACVANQTCLSCHTAPGHIVAAVAPRAGNGPRRCTVGSW